MQEVQEVQQPKPRGKRLYMEIAGIIMIAVGAYGLVSLHSPAAGVIGQRLAGWIRWCLGQAADLLPSIVIIAGILIFRGRAVPGLVKRTTGFLLLAVSILVIIHLQSRLPTGMEFTWRIKTYGDLQPAGTGAFGHFLSYLGLRAFGPNGTYIFLIAFLLIGLILLFDRGLKTMGLRLIRFVAGSRPSLPKRERGSEESKTRVSLLQRLSRRKLARQEIAAGQAGESKQPSGGDSGEEMPREAKSPRQKQPKKRRRKKIEKETEDFVSQPVRLEVPGSEFELPSTALLSLPKKKRVVAPREDQSSLLEDTLKSFGIECQVTNVDSGPVITRYEVRPARGTKVSRIVSLADDLALSLAAPDVRIEAPVPGKAVVGIEVPNQESSPVYLREVLESGQFVNHSSKLALALGKDIVGKPVIADLRKLLHLLIAGATGSGKSVCLNAIIASILYKATPDEVKIVMIDPKRVELANYNDVPHLISPVVTDPKKAAVALRWAVGEMEQRYQLFSATGTRNIDAYNQLVQERMAGKDSRGGQALEDDQGREEELRPLPYIVIIIDELADLMLVAGSDVEDSICRLAQMARAAGMYLIIATQRPSVDVITGLIKANIPSRIAFAVSSQVDSRTILDMGGAERLLGKGDMLFFPIGANKAIRAQGAFISDRDVENLVDFWKAQGKSREQVDIVEEAKSKAPEGDTDDELFPDAVRLVRDTGTASISMLQRRFRIGYARAARLIDMMEVSGIVGPYQGSKPREVIMTESEIDEFLAQSD